MKNRPRAEIDLTGDTGIQDRPPDGIELVAPTIGEQLKPPDDIDVIRPHGVGFCGVDDEPGHRGGLLGALAFGHPEISRWSHGDLTWSYDAAGSPLLPAEEAQLMATFKRACDAWQEASNFFTFSPAAPGVSADIRISWQSFGPSSDKLATGGGQGPGYLTLNSSHSSTASALQGTLTHELGHVFGLKHALGNSIMNPVDFGMTTIDPESRLVLHLMYGWPPARAAGQRGTDDRVGLGVMGSSDATADGTPWMAWKGNRGDAQIYYSELHDGEWTAQYAIPGFMSSHSPALTEWPIPDADPPRTGLVMGFKGAGDDHALYWSRHLGSGHEWEPPRPMPSSRSDMRPALATVNGRMFMACKGSDGDASVYISEFDGSDVWTQFARVDAVGGTSDAPAMVGVGERLFMFWKGAPGDIRGWWSVIDFAQPTPAWQPQERITYELPAGAPSPEPEYDIGTDVGFSATHYGETIYIAGKVVPGTAGWITVREDLAGVGPAFGGPVFVPEVQSPTGPSIIRWGDKILMAWQGPARAIYWSAT